MPWRPRIENSPDVWCPGPPASHTREAVPPALSREGILATKLRLTKVLPYQRSAPPFIGSLSLAILSGLLLVFAFPDWSFSTLAWIGTAPLILANAREQRMWRSFLLGLVTGTVFYLGSSYWVTYSMHHYGGMPLWVAYAVGVLIAAILGSFTGLFSAALSRSVSRFGGWAILAAPLLWPASEWARLQITGMGWNSLGYSQAFDPVVIQTARFGGVYLTSSILVAVSAGLVFAIVYIEKRRGLIVLTLVGVMGAANLLYGQRLRSTGDQSGSVTLGVIQPNFPISGDWEDPHYVSNMLDQEIKMSSELMSGGAIDMMVWPESPIPLEYDRDPNLRQRLAWFAQRNNVYLFFNTWESPDNSGTRNSAVAISPSGEKIYEYDKIALLPYGEYVPGKGWLPFMDRVTAVVGDVTPGKTPTICGIAGASVGTIICFEVTRPDLARLIRLKGASSLVQLSDEAWFGPSAAAKQMLAYAVFRAVENDVDIVRSTNSGMSARISRLGVVEGTTPLFQTAGRKWQIKSADEARGYPTTFYTRFGDLFVAAAAGASVLIFALGFIPYKRRIQGKGWKR